MAWVCRGACVDTCRHSWRFPEVARPMEGSGGSLPCSPTPSTLPSSPSVWLLLSRSAACWPPQDGFSWLCQSCCHLFVLCWSQQSGSASNPEQLRELLPSLAIPLAPFLCCSSSLGLRVILSPAVSWAPPSLPTTPPPAPSSPLQVSPALSPRGQAAERGIDRGIHSSPCHWACPLSTAQTLNLLPLPHFSWDSPTHCSPEPSPKLQTEELRLGPVA